MQRRHHYDLAFEYYLRENAIAYVAVDEAKRSITTAIPTEGKLKNFDFVVYADPGPNLLVDVKGRKHSGQSAASMQNWVTRDDVTCLGKWSKLFGSGFVAAFVFLHWCETQPPDALFQEIFEFKKRWYSVQAILLDDYEPHMKKRSEKWDTVSLPAKIFQQHVRPLHRMLKG